ncbi:MAG: hypothetical protein NT005_06670 [Spirochaetes bacterium]|nr:hypothetical protein [Spirochaetota bacterium]
MRNFVMMIPFTAPRAAPTASAAAKAAHSPTEGMSLPRMHVVMASVDPIDRSKPPPVMAKVMPAAAIATMAALVSTLTMLAPERMLGVRIAKTPRVTAATA